MYTAFLLIGGNIGDRFANLSHAISAIRDRCGDIAAVSSIYETEAWGFTEQPAFLNQVVVLHTAKSPEALMSALLRIEEESGRLRDQKMGPRIIDIDILLINDIVHRSETLTIPHPSLHLRKFALVPLAEVAANAEHPVLGKTITELLTDCPDTLAVRKIS